MIENPSRLGLLGSMLNGRMCRFHPDNWHTPVDGVVTALSLVRGDRYMYDVEIAYHSMELTQTVKLVISFDHETRAIKRCDIV